MEPDTEGCKLQNSYDVQSCVLAAVSILIGTVACFYGYRFFKFMLFLAGFLVGFVITYLLCYLYLTDELSGKALEFKDQVFLGISVGGGLLAGLLTVCLFYVGLFLLGATMGWFVGMAFLPLMYKHSEYLAEHSWALYVILATFAIAGGILVICFQKVVIIISTSFQGAFLFVGGVDYYLENSKVLYYSVNILHGRHFDKSNLPHCWYTWMMVSFIPVMFIAGMVVQFCKTGEGSDHKQAFSRGSGLPMMGTPMQDFGDRQPILTDYE